MPDRTTVPRAQSTVLPLFRWPHGATLQEQPLGNTGDLLKTTAFIHIQFTRQPWGNRQDLLKATAFIQGTGQLWGNKQDLMKTTAFIQGTGQSS